MFQTTATDTQTTRTNRAKDRLEVVLCGNSQEIQAEDKGFEPSTGFPAPDFESGSNDRKANKNKASQNLATHVLTSIAKESLEASRQAVQILLNSIPLDALFSLGILGPILGALRDAERDIENI